MGMESYFIQLLPSTVIIIKDKKGCNQLGGKGEVTSKEILEKLNDWYKITYDRDNDTIIDNTIKIYFEDVDGYVQTITLAGCFSWYDESISLIYEISFKINGIQKSRFYHPLRMESELISEEDFKRDLKNIYLEKYNAFKKQFPWSNNKVPPGYMFYSQALNKKENMIRILKKAIGRKPTEP